MQLQNTRFATSQQETNTMNMLPFERFEEVDRMNREHQQLLSTPVEFEYEHGLVGELRFAQDDQPWSENIKRAVINMLQVNILKKEKYEGADKSDNQEPTLSFTNVEVSLKCFRKISFNLIFSELSRVNAKFSTPSRNRRTEKSSAGPSRSTSTSAPVVHTSTTSRPQSARTVSKLSSRRR